MRDGSRANSDGGAFAGAIDAHQSAPDADRDVVREVRDLDEDAADRLSEYEPDTEGKPGAGFSTGRHVRGSATDSGAPGVISSATSRAQPSEQTPVLESAPTIEAANDQVVRETRLQAQEAGREQSATVLARRKSDHQDAVQAAAAPGKKAGGGDSDASLPNTGFNLPSTPKQPYIRDVPNALTRVLREQLRSAAVREKGTSGNAAQAFCRSLGQTGLVTAFLMAQLNVRIDADASTATAAELSRSQEPVDRVRRCADGRARQPGRAPCW